MLDRDPKIVIQELKDENELLLNRLNNCTSVKNGEIGMNQSLKVTIEKQRLYIKALSELNDKYVEDIAKLKADMIVHLERK
jgi:hypothetical protein